MLGQLGNALGLNPAPWDYNDYMNAIASQAFHPTMLKDNLTPTQRLQRKREEAVKRFEEIREEIEAIDEVIRLMEGNPTITKILDMLAKLGIR